MKAIIKFLVLVCLVIPVHVFAAATITINVSQAPYNNVGSAQNVGVISTVEERTTAMTALVGAYRTVNNLGTFGVPEGTVFEFQWQDGSKEKGKVVNPTSTMGVVPIPGTQSKPPNGGLGYTNGPNGNSYGGSNVIGFTPIYGTQTVCVGGYCESITVVTGYQFIYGAGGGPRDQVV